jgi:hypothetical protein
VDGSSPSHGDSRLVGLDGVLARSELSGEENGLNTIHKT